MGPRFRALCVSAALAAGLLGAFAFPAPAQAEPRLSCVLNAIQQSFPVAAVREASGLVRSPFKRFIFQASRGRIYQDLAPYFGTKTAREIVPLTEATAPLKLRELDQALAGHGFPELKARQGGGFHQWKSAVEVIARKADEYPSAVSDWVVFHDQGQIAFVRSGEGLLPVELHALESGAKITPVSGTRLKHVKDNDLAQELVIRDYALKKLQGSFRLRRMSPATHDMRYPRDTLFEWDGDLVNVLKDEGGRSLPNLQKLTRFALREGISVSPSGAVSALPEVRKALERMYALAQPEQYGKFAVEFDHAMERAVYHELAYRSIGAREQLVRDFLSSPQYERFSAEFIDRHIGYVGATQYDIAQGMLAELSLYRFEREFQGVATPAASRSQRPLAGVDGYHSELLSWLEKNAPAFPRDIAGLVKELGGTGPFPAKAQTTDELKKLLQVTSVSLRKLEGQLKRHATHDKLTGVLDRAGLITDSRRSFPNNLIGNVGLGKARVGDDKIYTLAAFLDPQRVHGYLGAGGAGYRELRAFVPAARAPEAAEISAVLREIVNAPDFARQRDLIEKHAEQLSAYLLQGETSPETVRAFAKTLYGDRLASTVFSKTSVHDPNVISRFYPESYAEFEKMARYRYLFDLTHGLTTELVKLKLGKRKHIERALSGRWKAYSFDGLKDEEVAQALKSVLANGEHRLKKLSQAHLDRTTLVDAREEMEAWFGWDTYDMTFLRHSKNSDHWESLGAGWSCICFIRKTIFNPDVFRQF